MNKRQKILAQNSLNSEETVLKRLEYIYDKSRTDINAKIRNLQFRIDELTEEYDWAEDAEKDKIKSKIQSKIYQKQYQEQLQKQVDGILNQMQTQQYVTIADYLNECYSDGFVGTIFDMHGQGVPLMMPINQESMVKAIQLDSKISKGLYTKLGVDVATLKKRIAAQVTRGIANGSSFREVAEQLNRESKIGRYKSMRIARTEGHRIQNTAIMDASYDARDRGADLVKQWDATLDGKTRDSHVAVDMEIRELDEAFSNGLQYPSDPAGSAAEVINCRCRLNQRARWALGGSFTKFNNFTKQIEEFESPEAYEDFKKGFFSAENKEYMNYVQRMEKKYGKDFKTVLEQMNEREYNHYSKLLKSNPVYNKQATVTQPYFHDVSATTTKLKKAMGDTDYNAFMAMVQTNAEIAPMYDHLDEIPEVKYNAKKAEYWLQEGHMWYNYPHQYYIDNGMSRYRTVAHEYGHFVDRFPHFGHIDNSSGELTWNEMDAIGAKIPNSMIRGWLMGDRTISNSDKFLGAMRKDFDKIISEGKIVDYCKAREDTTVSIQDAVDGWGLGRIAWGHGDKYYNREYANLVWYEKNTPNRFKTTQKPTEALKEIYTDLGLDASNQTKVKKIARQYDTASELWANMVSAETTGGLELASIQEQFPETYKAFKELLKVVK